MAKVFRVISATASGMVYARPVGQAAPPCAPGKEGTGKYAIPRPEDDLEQRRAAWRAFQAQRK